MVEYYENEATLDARPKRGNPPQEMCKILQVLERRMAPRDWKNKAFAALRAMS